MDGTGRGALEIVDERGAVHLPEGCLALEGRDAFTANRDAASTLAFGDEARDVPLVTIAIPTYRRPDLLLEALASAVAQQGAPPFEVIVVDNDVERPEAALEVARRFPPGLVRLYRNARNLGMAGNWNRCLELARGQWVTILHDDDLVAPGLLRSIEPLLRSSDVDFVACDSVIDADPATFHRALASWRPKRWRRIVGTDLQRIDPLRIVMSNVVAAPGAVMRRSAAIALGGFRDELYPISDYEFFARCCLHGRGVGIAVPLAFYRLHPAAATLHEGTLVRMARLSLALQARVPVRGVWGRIVKSLLMAARRVTWLELIANGRARAHGAGGDIDGARAALGLPKRYAWRAFRAILSRLGDDAARVIALRNALAARPLARRFSSATPPPDERSPSSPR